MITVNPGDRVGGNPGQFDHTGVRRRQGLT